MTTRGTYKEAKKMSLEIEAELKSGNLAAEETQRLEELHAQLAGVLLHPWFPDGRGRRAIMALILLKGIYGFASGESQLLLFWPILPLFSPRIVGEAAYAYGRLLKK